MAVSLSAIKNELLPGLFEVKGKYQMIEKQYSKIFSKRKSSMALERSTSMRFLALPKIKGEGQSTAFDNNAGERFAYNIEHIEVALGLI